MLSVTLSPDQERFVLDHVASGRYLTAREMVEEGLRLLEKEESQRAAAIESLRHEIQLGTDEADRGEIIDGDEVFAEMERVSQLRRQSR